MNPFDLTGPPFLVFYAVLASVLLVLFHRAMARDEAGDPPQIDTSDPYLLAYLRGGSNHALSVAVISLVDRGLLHAPSDDMLEARGGARDIARRPIEKAILTHFASSAESTSIFSEPALVSSARAYDDDLRRLDLLPSSERMGRRTTRFLLAAGVLLAVSMIRLVLAYQRGRRNVGFLILLTILAIGVTWVVMHPRLTGKGKRLLQDLAVLFDGVRARAAAIVPGGGSVELPILAAVFGLAAVPQPTFPYVNKLFPKARSRASSCGSSCGSSGGGSSGGGDAGGGCGGGGGGCGGCGGD